MLTGDWIYWLALLGIVILYIGLIYLACWSLYGERQKGKRRCPKCWYDLTYSEGLRCSECGHVARHERDLARRRPRYGYAALAIAACVAIALYIGDFINQRGWASVLPTKSLIVMLPVVDESTSPLYGELTRRMGTGQLSEREWSMLVSRCVAGDWGARPPSEAWVGKYGSLLSRWRGSIDPKGELGAMMLTLPPRVQIDTSRKIWPRDVPVMFDVFADDWWPQGTAFRIRATPRLEGAATDVHERYDDPIQPRSYSIIVPAPPPDATMITLDLEYERRLADADAWEPAGQHTLQVPVRIEGTLADHLEPVRGDEYDALMKQVFTTGVVKYAQGGSLPVRVSVQPGATFVDAFDGVGVGVTIEVLHADDLGRKLNIWWVAGTGVTDRQYAWEVPTSNERVLMESDPSDGRWRLRITGQPSLALLVDGVKKYWDGRIEVPAPVRLINSAAPDRGWRPEHIVDYDQRTATVRVPDDRSDEAAEPPGEDG